VRLDRLIAKHCGKGRREVRGILAGGAAEVNGVVVLNGRADVGEFEKVTLDGEVLQDRRPIYVMLNKPAGCVGATVDDEHPTVMEFLGDAFGAETLHIAGRLDKESTGLLLLTNDGKWSRDIGLPEESHGKVYLVETESGIADDTAEKFSAGIYFGYEDITTGPAQLEVIAERQARLTIYEGKYHQVKRMFHAVGNRVISLHRERVGRIELDPDLAPGEWRELQADEVGL